MSPVRSGETFEAYRTTTVAVHESQADVRQLLRNRKATGLSISESWMGEQAVAEVRFAIPASSGGYFAYRLRVHVPEPDPEQLRKRVNQSGITRPPTASEITAQKSQAERQIWRLVYWWLKAQFEAAEAGLVALEEALLPWMELPDGRTVFEVTSENGALARIAAGTEPLKLLSGADR